MLDKFSKALVIGGLLAMSGLAHVSHAQDRSGKEVVDAVCASCHRTIDPLGFAFDHFDAIGAWRTEERVDGGKGANPPVNASGVLSDGRAFDGPDEFKALLAADLDRFAEAFVGQLATFALRRVMTVDDAPRIKAIAEAAKADGYPLRAILENFVTSDLFLQR